MTGDGGQKLVLRLTREEVEELARLVGPAAADKWWYREWLVRHGEEPKPRKPKSRRRDRGGRG